METAVEAHTRARHQLDYYIARKAEQDVKIAQARERQANLEKEYTVRVFVKLTRQTNNGLQKWRDDVLARFNEHPNPRKRSVLEKLLKAKEQAYARGVQE